MYTSKGPYTLSAYLQTQDEEVEVSPHILEIVMMHSLTIAFPEVFITFTSYISDIFRYGYSQLLLQIKYTKYSNEELFTETYNLIPAQTQAYIKPIVRSLGDHDHVSNRPVRFRFRLKNCVQAAFKECEPLIKFNTNAKEIIESVKPENVEIITNIESSKNIPQVYIPKSPFLELVRYLNRYFGFEENPTFISLIPDTEQSTDCKLIIRDIQKISKSDFFEKEIICRPTSDNTDQNYATEEATTQKKIILDTPIIFRSKSIPHNIKHIIITKPNQELFKKTIFDVLDVFKEHTFSQGDYDPRKESSTLLDGTYRALRWTGHTGLSDGSPDPVISRIGTIQTSLNRAMFDLVDMPLCTLWPCQIVRIKTDNPDDVDQTGNYLVESVYARLSRLETDTFQGYHNVSLIRSNRVY